MEKVHLAAKYREWHSNGGGVRGGASASIFNKTVF